MIRSWGCDNHHHINPLMILYMNVIWKVKMSWRREVIRDVAWKGLSPFSFGFSLYLFPDYLTMSKPPSPCSSASPHFFGAS